jgi:peptidoglycan hydrolase-like protein with peptidoglycan-binding domain
MANDSGVEVASDKGVQIASIAPGIAASAERALGLSRDDAKAVQSALNGLGYKAGAIDGDLGKRSRKAIASFPLKAGLPSTGVVTQ